MLHYSKNISNISVVHLSLSTSRNPQQPPRSQRLLIHFAVLLLSPTEPSTDMALGHFTHLSNHPSNPNPLAHRPRQQQEQHLSQRLQLRTGARRCPSSVHNACASSKKIPSQPPLTKTRQVFLLHWPCGPLFQLNIAVHPHPKPNEQMKVYVCM